MPETVIMLVCGVISHFMQELIRIKVEKGHITIKQYWIEYPYHTVLAIVCAVVGYISLESTGQLNEVTAFGAGYMSNAVADTIGKRTLNKL